MASPPRRLPPKKDVMLGLLEKSGVFLHIDPRRDGVLVPQGFKQQPELVLQVGLNMAVPIRDLEVDDEGVSCTLSFNRRPFWCRMPWPSIYAIVSDEDRRGVVWPEDVPRESKMSSAQAQPPAPKRPKLRAVRDGESAPPPEPSEGEAEATEAPQGAGTCGGCGTKWVEDQESCPLCGATRREAFRAEGEPEREKPRADEPVAPAAEPAAAADGAEAPAAGSPAEEAATTSDVRSPSEPPDGGKKPKRQLPPYLRIVK